MRLNMEREYQICTRCVMDTTDEDIIFDEYGYCNHCKNALEKLKNIFFWENEIREKELEKIIDRIKNNRTNKYDCVIYHIMIRALTPNGEFTCREPDESFQKRNV